MGRAETRLIAREGLGARRADTGPILASAVNQGGYHKSGVSALEETRLRVKWPRLIMSRATSA